MYGGYMNKKECPTESEAKQCGQVPEVATTHRSDCEVVAAAIFSVPNPKPHNSVPLALATPVAPP